MGCCPETMKRQYESEHRARKNPLPKSPKAIDNGFEFQGEPPLVEGFRPEGSALISEFPECGKRTHMPYLGADGEYSIKSYCRHRKSPLRGQLVILNDCESCPFRNPS